MAESAFRDLHGAPPPGMAPFLVTFDRWRGSGEGRREETLSQIELAEVNRAKLMEFIERKGLKDDVGVIASATLIGAIGVIMTPRAAESIAAMDGVVRVMRAR